jgi:phosphatidylinositol phospholipase C beta
MFGLPADTVRRRFKTKPLQNSTNIVWDEDTWEFKKVIAPDLAMLRFAVYDDNSKLLGQRVLPVPALQAGYRHIPLRNEFNQPLGLASVFVEFTMSDYVPDGMADLIDALANPIAYQSEVQKREKQLEELYDDDETDSLGDQVVLYSFF